MNIQEAVKNCNPIKISQRVSENEMTIVRTLRLVLDPEYRFMEDIGGLNSYQQIMNLDVIPKPGDKLDTTWIPTMYKTVNFWCKDVAIDQEKDSDETQFIIVVTYLGRGLNYCQLEYGETTTRILEYSVDSQEYDFQEALAYAGPSSTAEQNSNKATPIENSAKDPILDGAKEVRAIQIMRIKLEVPGGSDCFLYSGGKMGFQNVVNQEKVTMMGLSILKHCGLASIKSYHAINPHSTEASYYEVDLEIKVKSGLGLGTNNNPQDTWDFWSLDQGFKYLDGGKPKIITNKMINTTTDKDPNVQVSDPVPLNGSGGILTDYSTISTRYWLKYQIQNEVSFDTFGIPASEQK